MKEISFAARFFDDLETVELESKQDEIMGAIEKLPFVPEMGSRRVSDSILEEFGPRVRKLVVKPFLVVYEDGEDGIRVHGIVHQRQAR